MYTGFDKHEGKDVGGWDTVIKRAEYSEGLLNKPKTYKGCHRNDLIAAFTSLTR